MDVTQRINTVDGDLSNGYLESKNNKYPEHDRNQGNEQERYTNAHKLPICPMHLVNHNMEPVIAGYLARRP
jgi:hypothetical protein